MGFKMKWDAPKLDLQGTEISFALSRTEMLDLVYSKSLPIALETESEIRIRSKLFSMEMEFGVFFRFNGERLTSVFITPSVVPMEKTARIVQFDKIQNAMESEFDTLHWRSDIYPRLFGLEDRYSCGRRKNIRIEHQLYEHFTMREEIRISIR